MTDTTTITCPKCRAKIPLSDAVAAPLLEAAKVEFEKTLAAEREHFQQEEIARARDGAKKEVADQLLAANLDRQTAVDRADRLNRETTELNGKLAAAQNEQARLMGKERELEDERRELELTIARRTAEAAETIRLRATADAKLQFDLAASEKDILIASLTGKIDELKQRAAQGDNRVAGEAQELVLEAMLRSRFPMDKVEPVGKGVHGGDCLQTVVDGTGRVCGTILWESKRTKSWDDKWLPKLRDDQRAARADLAVLVTQTLPKEVSTFDQVAGVWVAGWAHAIPVVMALRHGLMGIAAVKVAQDGQGTKMEVMYGYLTGPRFKARMQAVVERFGEMAEDLRRERAAMTRGWAKREGQIQSATEAAAGMVGDLQSIGGAAMGEIEGLRLEIGAGTGAGAGAESK